MSNKRLITVFEPEKEKGDLNAKAIEMKKQLMKNQNISFIAVLTLLNDAKMEGQTIYRLNIKQKQSKSGHPRLILRQ